MRTHVTAILVAKHQGEKLDATVEALKAQSVAPERVIVVAAGSNALASSLGASGFDAVFQVNEKLSFGAAVAAGLRGVETLDPTQPEWLWLLAEDSAPEPQALAHLLLSVKTTGTAAVAGPKLVDWDDPSRIIELSQGLTSTGARWVLDRQELDQQQYDHYEDVLGVGPVGMMVRRDVWQKLGGFDPALPVYDDGLDFSVRARLAGYRVVVAPQARLRFARSGVAGPEINHRGRVLRRAHRRARAAALHRRVAYAPAMFAPFIWLALPFIGVIGMLWALIRERPGTMLGELLAALQVFVRPGRILQARRRIRAHTTVGWKAVRPLRTDLKTVRSVRTVRKEAILEAQGMGRTELHFMHTGGLGLTVTALLGSVAISWWLLGSSFVSGGSTGQLSASLSELWASTISAAAVNVQSLTSFVHTVPADPFTWVLALFGSLTFWNPSYALVLVMVLAIPVAAMGGWMWAARLTEHAAGRLLGGVAWCLAPVLMTSLVTGRLGAIVLAMTLPWLLCTLAQAHKSWSFAGISAFLAGVTLAAAPSLIPAAIVLLIIGIVVHPRGFAKLLSVAIVPAVLFAPKILSAVANGRPVEIFMDPGVLQSYAPASLGEALLGFPASGVNGVSEVLSLIGLSDDYSPWIITFILSAPLFVLAVAGAVTGRPKRTVLIAGAGLAGLVTATVAPHIALGVIGTEQVAIWSGSGIALYWIAVISLAVVGTRVLFKAQLAVAIVAMVGVLAIVAPQIVQIATADTSVRPDRLAIPAVMNAELRTNPDAQALVVTPLNERDVRARLVGGSALTIDHLRTAEHTAPRVEADETLSELLATLASPGATGVAEELSAQGITFVLLEESRAADATQLRSLMQEIFDQSDALSPVGSTSHGQLWRVSAVATGDGDLADDPLAIDTTDARPVSGKMLWAVQLIVLALMFLLALPTGEVRERPAKRGRRGFSARSTSIAATISATGAAPGGPEVVAVDTEPEEGAGGGAGAAGEIADAGTDAGETDETGEIAIVHPENEIPDDDTIFVGGHGDPRTESRDAGDTPNDDRPNDEKAGRDA